MSIALTILASTGAAIPDPSLPPPGTTVGLPAAPSTDAAALRFTSGTEPTILYITPDTPASTINAAFARSVALRAAFGVPSTSPHYRVTLVAAAGEYDVEPWTSTPPFTSIIAAETTSPPSVVLASYADSKWAGVLQPSSLYLEGVEVLNGNGADDGYDNGSLDPTQVGDGSTGEKYCIHFAGGYSYLNLAHCILRSTALTHANLGMDNNSGDRIQFHDVKWINLPGVWAMNGHCGNTADLSPVRIKLKNCDVSQTGVFAWDDLSAGAVRWNAGIDQLWVNNTPGLVSAGADPLPVVTDTIVWESV